MGKTNSAFAKRVVGAVCVVYIPHADVDTVELHHARSAIVVVCY